MEIKEKYEMDYKELDFDLNMLYSKRFLSLKNKSTDYYTDSIIRIDEFYTTTFISEEKDLLNGRMIKLLIAVEKFKLITLPIVITLIFSLFLSGATDAYEKAISIFKDFNIYFNESAKKAKNLLTANNLNNYKTEVTSIYTNTKNKFIIGDIAIVICLVLIGLVLVAIVINIYDLRAYKLLVKEYEIEKIKELLYMGKNKENNKREKSLKENTKKKSSKDKVDKKYLSESKDIYPSAHILLDISRDEYTKEKERTNFIDNKLGIFITAIFAITTIYIPIIPFDKFKNIYTGNEKVIIILATIFILILSISIICLFIALFYFINAITLKPFNRVSHESLIDEENLKCFPNIIEKSLVEYYCGMLENNTNINNTKAKKFSKGLIYVTFFFVLLMVSSIGLLIIV